MLIPALHCDRCGAVDQIADLKALVRELAAEAHRPRAGHRPGPWVACVHPVCTRAALALDARASGPRP